MSVDFSNAYLSRKTALRILLARMPGAQAEDFTAFLDDLYGPRNTMKLCQLLEAAFTNTPLAVRPCELEDPTP